MNGRGTGMSPDGRFNLVPVAAGIPDPYGEGRGVTDGYLSSMYLQKVIVPSVYECNTPSDFISLIRNVIVFMESTVVEINLTAFYEAFADRLTNTTVYNTAVGLQHEVSERLRSLWSHFYDPMNFMSMLSSNDWMEFSSYRSDIDQMPEPERFTFDREDTADFESAISSYLGYYLPRIPNSSPAQDSLEVRTASVIRSMISQTHYRFQNIKEELHVHKVRSIRERYSRESSRSLGRDTSINYWELLHESSRGFVGVRLNGQDINAQSLNFTTEPGSVTTLNVSVLIQPGRDILGITEQTSQTTLRSTTQSSPVTSRVPEPANVTIVATTPEPEPVVDQNQPVSSRRYLDL